MNEDRPAGSDCEEEDMFAELTAEIETIIEGYLWHLDLHLGEIEKLIA